MGTKIWSRAFAVAAIAGLTFAACGAQGPAATTAPTAAATAGTAAPTAAAAQRGAGGNLTILYWQAVTALVGHHAQGTKDFDAARLVLEPLASTGPDGKQVANLAAEIPTKANGGLSADGTAITWKLKQNVKWADGSDFTSADVLFTYNYVTNKDTAATTAGVYSQVSKVEATDKFTVKVTYKAPTANPYQAFTAGTGQIIQEKQYKDFIGAKAKEGPKIPVGTGPYKVTDFKPNDVVTYEINANYRDATKPYFKTVTFKGGGDAASAARAVCQTGDVDYAWNLQVEATVLKPLVEAGDSKCQMATATSPNVERILINRTNPASSLGDKRGEPDQPHPFLSDLKVRQALAKAVDRGPIAALYGPGLAGNASCNIIVGIDAYTSKNTAAMDVCKYDIAAANKLLDEAGAAKGADGIRVYKGARMKIVYQTTVNTLRQKEQEIVKAGWTQLGIEVELKAVPAGTFFGTEGNDTAAKFFTDVEMFTNGASQITQDDYALNWICSEIKTKAAGWSGNNYERWCSKDYDALYNQFVKELDEAKRNDLLIKMNDLLVQDVVVIPLVARTQPTDGRSKALKNIIPTAWDSVLWNIADWAK
jgi:peptide/nickel transport system substrate-binding protein